MSAAGHAGGDPATLRNYLQVVRRRRWIILQPDRIAQTQADVARVPERAQKVLAHVGGSRLTVQQFLGLQRVERGACAAWVWAARRMRLRAMVFSIPKEET